MSHISVDLETLGRKPGCIITQIGLVAFNAKGVIDRTQIYVDAVDCQKHGLTIDADTVLWWLKQSAEARKHFELPADRLIPALTKSINFFKQHLGDDDKVWGNGSDFDKVWGNGSDFDNVILQAAFEAVGSDVPWKFWQNACYRTVKGLVHGITAEPFGTAHVGVDDAEKQALHLIKIAQLTGLPL